ncbi:MAG: hypothetical protein ACE14W_00200 [Candidatus Velamenicoccus archaeovorus]
MSLPSRLAMLHARLADALLAARGPDGGYGPRSGQGAEPEPTALAALALDDDGARAWLAEHQSSDGGLELALGSVVNDSPTALAALALGPGAARERALDHVVRAHARRVPSSAAVPLDPALTGWGWTPDTSAWVEPTARTLLALRRLRPAASEAIAEAVAVLEDRECVGGGWNYGNRIVLGEELPPFAQTTAIALVALQDDPPELSARGRVVLRRLWRVERGGLTLGTTLAAFRLLDDAEADAVSHALAATFERTGLLGDTVALAWAALATGPGVEGLRWGNA